MGAWMDQKLGIGDFCASDKENLTGSDTIPDGDEVLPNFELPTEATSEFTGDEREAYILDLQVKSWFTWIELILLRHITILLLNL